MSVDSENVAASTDSTLGHLDKLRSDLRSYGKRALGQPHSVAHASALFALLHGPLIRHFANRTGNANAVGVKDIT
jgi:hypothetical protein